MGFLVKHTLAMVFVVNRFIVAAVAAVAATGCRTNRRQESLYKHIEWLREKVLDVIKQRK